MPAAPLPHDEVQRLAALVRLEVLDSAPEAQFDALVQAAALVCNVPIALISLVDADRQWFKANLGLPGVTQTTRESAFCAHTILQDGLMEVTEATRDARFAENPLVVGQPEIRFYAGAPLRLRGGQTVGTLCVIDRQSRVLDATQRQTLALLAVAAIQALESRISERQFIASEAKFRALSESAPFGVFATDEHRRPTYGNARWHALLSGAQAPERDWLEAVHPDDRPTVASALERSAETHEGFDLELRVRRADGGALPVRMAARPLVENGTVTGYVGAVEDITGRLKARGALLDERRRLAGILEGTGAGTWEWNVQTGETRFNERWAEIVGTTLEELGPTDINTWASFVPPEDLALSRVLLQRHFDGETASYECEARMRHRDGHLVWVLDRGRVLTRTADGRPEWMFGTHLDITARKAQEAALRSSEELLARTGELAQVGGWELDLGSGRLVWSAQTRSMHGVGPDYEPLLEEAVDFYAPEARPVILRAVEQAIREGGGWDLELPLEPRGGGRIWVRAVGSAEVVDGRTVRLVGALQDITTRVDQRLALERAHERVSLATDGGRIGIWDLDLTAGALAWDAWMFRLYGIPVRRDLDLRECWLERVHPEDRRPVEDALQGACADRDTLDLEYRVVWPDGSIHHLRSAARVGRDGDGQPIRVVGAAWDVTDLRRLESELQQQHELLRVTLQSIADAVITTDAAGAVSWLNPVAERMTGWESSEARGRPLGEVFRLVDEITGASLEDPVTADVAATSRRVVLVGRGGTYGVEDSTSMIRNDHGEVLGTVVVFRDVTEQRRLNGEMRHRATHDALTGLVNRAEFESRLHRTLHRSLEEGGEHALLYIDLDQFKLVNDSCGHTVGDQLLVAVSRVLAECVRGRDTLARLGGDEFAVILEHCTIEQAGRVAQKICDRMDDFRFAHDERRFRIGASIGLVPVDRRWSNSAAILQAADASCYAAKEAGRNRVYTWFDTDVAVRERKGEMQWATRLEQALDDDRFVFSAPLIQALRDPPPGVHAEVLLRMVDTDGSLKAPGAFLPAAERFHLSSRIDRWVLRHAIAALEALDDLSAVDTLCVNVSGQSVGDRAFHQHAMELLVLAGERVCRRLCLEITETAAVTNMGDAARFIREVRTLGVRVALDDFGAGASSFGYLKTLTVDVLKIDGQFIRGLVTDPLDDAAVRCFVDVARVLGLQTVAEFVDHPDVLRRLGEIGVDNAQGFLLHRPEPIAGVLAGTGAGRMVG